MQDTRLVSDSVEPVLAAIRERGIRIDPIFAGECRQLFSNAGIRANYCRKAGLNIDDVSELLYDRGFTLCRLDGRETLDLLDMLLQPRPERARRAGPRSVSAVDRAVEKSRKMRLRKFQCPNAGCRQIVRASRNASVLCGVCYEVDGEIVVMRRVDVLPEELLETAAFEVSAKCA